MIAGAEAILIELQVERLFKRKADYRTAVRARYHGNFSANRLDWSGHLCGRSRRNGYSHSLGRVGGSQSLAPLRRCSDAADDEFVVFHASNHVHIDHGHRTGERQDRMIDVVIRTQQPFLFAAESHEDDGAARPELLRTKQTRQLEHAGGARSVVVSAVMYLACARRQAAFAAVAEVIVVRADCDDFVFQGWIRAIE